MRRTPRIIFITAAVAVVLVIAGIVGFRLMPEGFRGRRLLNALNGGHITTARVMIMLGANPNFNTGHGTAMHYAAGTGDLEFMRFLVKHGAAVDVPGVAGLTPYQVARLKGFIRVERYLLDQGANPDIRQAALP